MSSSDHAARLIVVDQTCPTWSVALNWQRRLRDRLRHGHARHRCTRDGPLHQDDHRCACGVTFPLLWPPNDQPEP